MNNTSQTKLFKLNTTRTQNDVFYNNTSSPLKGKWRVLKSVSLGKTTKEEKPREHSNDSSHFSFENMKIIEKKTSRKIKLPNSFRNDFSENNTSKCILKTRNRLNIKPTNGSNFTELPAIGLFNSSNNSNLTKSTFRSPDTSYNSGVPVPQKDLVEKHKPTHRKFQVLKQVTEIRTKSKSKEKTKDKMIKQISMSIKKCKLKLKLNEHKDLIPNLDKNSLLPDNLLLTFNKYPKPRFSNGQVNKFIRSFAVNSYQGLSRTYNEDKVSIILSISKSKNRPVENWPESCSYLAIYDGHGGSRCCNFLRDHLHNYIIKSKFFPSDPEKALLSGFRRADKDFIDNIGLKEEDKSGSCATVLLILDNMCYIANLGDSRIIASFNGGTLFESLTRDHKPNDPIERERIIANGGSVYANKVASPLTEIIGEYIPCESGREIFRITPGRLSVSRAFGDIFSKIPSLGGKTGVLSAVPDIFKVDLSNPDKIIDFIIMGCDGIYDNLSTNECCQCVWNLFNWKGKSDINLFSGNAVDLIIKSALKRKSMDNLTSLFLSFENFEKMFNAKKKK